MIALIVLLAIGAVLVVYFVGIYNSLVAVRERVKQSWANIDVLLKQRHDELPKLVKVAEAYMQHERAIFDKLSEARGALAEARTVGQRANAENQITRALGSFFAVAENYPDLKANQAFHSLQQRISELENAIADRREFYNDIVTMFNTRIEQIPDLWVAQGMTLQKAELFKIEESERRDVEIAFRMTA